MFRAGLKSVDTDDLLETVETNDDKAIVQFGGRCFVTIDFVKEETIKGQRLFVNDVAPTGRKI